MIAVESLADAEAEQRWIAARLRDAGAAMRLATCSYADPVLLLPARQIGDAGLTRNAARMGLNCRRRHGGGTAVLAGPWMASVDLWVPAGTPGMPEGFVALRSWLGSIHERALADLGIPAQCAASAAPPQEPRYEDVPDACFGSTSAGEVTDLQGRKMVGISLHRNASGTWLGAGTLVGDCDWPLLGAVLGLPAAGTRALIARTASCRHPLRAVLGRISAHLQQAIAVLAASQSPDHPRPATAAA